MGKQLAATPENVTVYPVPGGLVPGVPHIEQTVPANEAEFLLAFGGPHNPQFTDRPLSVEELNALRLAALEPEEPEPPAPPTPSDEGTEQTTGPDEESGPTDS